MNLRPHILALGAVFVLTSFGCGKGGSDAGPAPSKCSEKNALTVTWSSGNKELHEPGAFTLKDTKAFLGGSVNNGKTMSKAATLILSSNTAEIGKYGVEMPKEPGQINLVFQFHSPSVPSDLKTQKADYAKLSLAKGGYVPSVMRDSKSPKFELTYYLSGKNSGSSVSAHTGAKGSAKLSSVDGHLCGTVDFTTAKGSTIKGSFNTPIISDLWE
ncbi:MAG: hypothetical protein ACI9MR_003142 [Myxococcota bacterium]|jgi:hypothetical protein